jgi:hypothetical protein
LLNRSVPVASLFEAANGSTAHLRAPRAQTGAGRASTSILATTMSSKLPPSRSSRRANSSRPGRTTYSGPGTHPAGLLQARAPSPCGQPAVVLQQLRSKLPCVVALRLAQDSTSWSIYVFVQARATISTAAYIYMSLMLCATAKQDGHMWRRSCGAREGAQPCRCRTHLVLYAGHDDAVELRTGAERFVKQQHAVAERGVAAQAAPQRDCIGGERLERDHAVPRGGDRQRERAEVSADVEQDRRPLAGGVRRGRGRAQPRQDLVHEPGLPLAGAPHAGADLVAVPARPHALPVAYRQRW